MEKTQDNQVIGNPRRLVLKQAVANILMEKGFETVEKQCIETLTEMIQSCTYTEFGRFFQLHFSHSIPFDNSNCRNRSIIEKLLRIVWPNAAGHW